MRNLERPHWIQSLETALGMAVTMGTAMASAVLKVRQPVLEVRLVGLDGRTHGPHACRDRGGIVRCWFP